MKNPLQVQGAPAAIGPYSQAQVVRLHGGNKVVYTSGQVALDPATGELGELGFGTAEIAALARQGVVHADES